MECNYNKEDTYFKDLMCAIFRDIAKENNIEVEEIYNTLKCLGKFDFKDR